MKNELHEITRRILSRKYYFGACPCLREDIKFFNVGSAHWLYCDECKVRWCVGENSFSKWKDEDEEIWKNNMQKYGEYRIIDGNEFLQELDNIFGEPNIA